MQFVNSADAATMLGVSPEAIRRMFRRGQLPGQKINDKCIVFDPKEVEKLKQKALGDNDAK